MADAGEFEPMQQQRDLSGGTGQHLDPLFGCGRNELQQTVDAGLAALDGRRG